MRLKTDIDHDRFISIHNHLYNMLLYIIDILAQMRYLYEKTEKK
ncbi:hypothetical protein [Candidatus Moranella endobia]|nr:hypothetical protein [Candidatus Moranella endobia]